MPIKILNCTPARTMYSCEYFKPLSSSGMSMKGSEKAVKCQGKAVSGQGKAVRGQGKAVERQWDVKERQAAPEQGSRLKRCAPAGHGHSSCMRTQTLALACPLAPTPSNILRRLLSCSGVRLLFERKGARKALHVVHRPQRRQHAGCQSRACGWGTGREHDVGDTEGSKACCVQALCSGSVFRLCVQALHAPTQRARRATLCQACVPPPRQLGRIGRQQRDGTWGAARKRRCLSRASSGKTSQRQCLKNEGSGDARQRRCLSHEGSRTREAKAGLSKGGV